MSEQKQRKTIRDIKPDVRDVFSVQWPGVVGQTANLMLLRCNEIQEANFAAVDYFRRKVQPTDGVNFGEFMREKERQEVARMLLQPDSLRPIDKLMTPDEVRKELSIDEVNYFQREHQTHSEQLLKDAGININIPSGEGAK